MVTVKISCPKLEFQLRLATDHEHVPKLYLWLSQNVSSDVRTLDASAAVNGKPLDLSFQSGTAVVNAEERQTISDVERIQFGYLNIGVFCDVHNKHGEHALNQAGDVSIPLRELLGTGSTKRYPLIIPSWGDPNARGANRDPLIENNKGWVQLYGPVQILYNGQLVPPLSAASIAFAQRVESDKEQTSRQYMSSIVRFCKSLGYTWESTSLINAYIYQCRGGRLPAAAYLNVRLGGTRKEYFENAARIVLARFSESMDKFDWLKDPRGPAMLVRVLTLAANYCAYIPDRVFFPSTKKLGEFLARALESFDYARIRSGGDCEDLALEIVLEAAELLALDMDRDGDGGSMGLPGMISLRNQFVASMALGGVSGAEIKDMGKAKKKMGAHMWSIFVPVELWHQWWMNGNLQARDALPLFGKMQPEKTSMSPLVGEGTGFLEPRPVPSSEEAQIRVKDLYQKLLEKLSPRGFAGARRMFHYRRDRRSAFYQTFSILFTNHFLRKPGMSPYICFAVCSPQRHTIGVSFEEVVRGGPGAVALWAEPCVNQIESACIRDSMNNMFPMPPLQAPDPAVEARENYPFFLTLERIYQPIDGPAIEAEFFFKTSLCTKDHVTALQQAFQSKILQPLLYRVTVHREAVTPKLGGYRLVLHLKPLDVSDLESLVHQARPADGSGDDEEEEDEDEDAF
jgi:hypothetical protein